MRVLALLCVVLCGICGVNAASHSLKYVCTAVTWGTDFLDFTIMGLVDDEPFVYYDSSINRMIPQTEWMDKSVDKQYWDKQTQKALDAHQTFEANIRNAMQHYHSTQVVHHFQYGCQRDDDTRDPGQIEHYEYHGKGILTDDMKTWPFITPAQQLFVSAVKWNLAKRKNYTQYMTQICVEALKKYVSYRMIALGRTVAPEVSLLQKDPSSPGVTCHVTGFYPRDITITWQRNGEDLDVDVELGETVPNEDGTFQTTSYLTVKPEDWKSQNYTCTVQHKSLKQDIILPVKEENIYIAPEVSLLQKDSSSPGVTCHVTGFYPCDIMVTWQRNGEDLDIEPGETVRNGDGTFQTTSYLTVKPEDWKSQNYTCTVQHESLKQDIVLPVKEENIKRNTDIKTHSFMGVIIGCVVGALILILLLNLAVIGVVMSRKRSSDYGRTSTSDPESPNSNNMQLQRLIQQTPDQRAATDTDSVNSTQPAATGTDSANSNRPAATDTGPVNSTQPAATGTDSANSNRPAATGTDSVNCNQPAATDTNQPAATDTDSVNSNQPAATDTDSVNSNQPAVSTSPAFPAAIGVPAPQGILATKKQINVPYEHKTGS